MLADVIEPKSQTKPDPFADIDVPPEFQASLDRHRENLARLVMTLQAAGTSEEQIESSVAVVVASYKEELVRAIKAMVR